RQTLEGVPDQSEALLNLGVLLAEQGQVDEAIGHWQRLLRLQPDHAQARHNLGVAQAQLGRFDEAVTNLERYDKVSCRKPLEIVSLYGSSLSRMRRLPSFSLRI